MSLGMLMLWLSTVEGDVHRTFKVGSDGGSAEIAGKTWLPPLPPPSCSSACTLHKVANT